MGAQLSVIGQKQLKLYSAASEIKCVPSKVPRKYEFCTKAFPGTGNMNTRVWVADDFYIIFTPENVDANVPFVLGLDVLTHLKALLNFEDNWISFHRGNWRTPLTRKLGQLYISWSIAVYCTKQEIRKIHRNIHHPQTERLVSIIKRAAPENL